MTEKNLVISVRMSENID